MTDNRLTFALEALKYCGAQEGSADHAQILHWYNQITPLPRGYAMTQKDPWCAAFVSAMAWKLGFREEFPLECSCSNMINQARQYGIWQEQDDFVPQIGDLCLYDWQASENGENTGAPDHIGIVVSVEDGELRVVEGNYADSVKLRKIPIDWRYIRGFITPKFDLYQQEEAMYRTVEEVPAYARETIKKLVDGGLLFGYGDDRGLGLDENLVRLLVILERAGKL